MQSQNWKQSVGSAAGGPLVNLEISDSRRLAKNQEWRLSGDHRGQAVVCLSGCLWLTQTGDTRDYILEPGQAMLISLSGQVQIRALAPASARLGRLATARTYPSAFPQPSLA